MGDALRELFSHLNAIFEIRTKRSLALAGAGSVFVSLLDTVAIALVLPMMDLATGRGRSSQVVGRIAQVTGVHDLGNLTTLITGAVLSVRPDKRRSTIPVCSRSARVKQVRAKNWSGLR